MELTGVAICASLLMAVATVCVFIFAVKKDYFHDIEDTKYQVFWSDVEEMTDSPNIRGRAFRNASEDRTAWPTQEHSHARGSEESRS
jgi:hypothetical protein